MLINVVNEIVDKANKGKKNKEYSFNGFVVSTCQFALDNMTDDKYVYYTV